MTDEELFDHQVTAWTAGQLRKALEGVPDDLPVNVFIAEEPGGGTCDEQVVFSAQPRSGPRPGQRAAGRLRDRVRVPLRRVLPEDAMTDISDDWEGSQPEREEPDWDAVDSMEYQRHCDEAHGGECDCPPAPPIEPARPGDPGYAEEAPF